MSEIIREIEDRERRQTRIMLYNVPESKREQGVARKAEDTLLVKNICTEDLNMEDLCITDTVRIGKKSEDPHSHRPLRVDLSEKEMKQEILKQAGNLRSAVNPVTNKIYISADLTPVQRTEMKELLKERKIKQEELKLAGETGFTWIIRNDKLTKVRAKAKPE